MLSSSKQASQAFSSRCLSVTHHGVFRVLKVNPIVALSLQAVSPNLFVSPLDWKEDKGQLNATTDHAGAEFALQ